MAAIPLCRDAVDRVPTALVRLAVVAVVLLVAAVGCGSPPRATSAPGASSPAAAGDPSAPSKATGPAGRAGLRPTPTVGVAINGTYSWAFLDRTTGARYESDNANELTYAESMIKAWLAADYLALTDAAGEAPDLDLLSSMIRDSDDDAAETVWLDDGDDGSILRMINKCGLVDAQLYEGWWSMTLMSARDAVRLGECIATGTAAGPRWTSWLLGEMRQVRGEGRFGIIDALPATTAATVSIKNGWTLHYDDEEWRVNCLAVSDTWVLAVTTIYSSDLDLEYGSHICRDVAAQILATPPG